jgi:hypothetical protein
MTAATLPLRVTVLDTWEEYPFAVAATMRVSALKQAALDRAHLGNRAPGDYMVKYRGAELIENGDRTLEDSGVVPNAALIVLSRKRNPAK